MTLLSDAEIEKRLATLDGWRLDAPAGSDVLAAVGDVPAAVVETPAAIVCERKLEDFAGAIALVNRVAELAESANHHPDILIHGWNKVRLTLSTHSEGGLTEADFEFAARIDRLA